MSNHPSPVAQAFDIIHEEMRMLRRVNGELRKQVCQKDAAISIVMQERDDLKRQVLQLRGQCHRQAAMRGTVFTEAAGVAVAVSAVGDEPSDVITLRIEGAL